MILLISKIADGRQKSTDTIRNIQEFWIDAPSKGENEDLLPVQDDSRAAGFPANT